MDMNEFNTAMASGAGMLWNELIGDKLAGQLQSCGIKVPPKPDTAERTSCLYGKKSATMVRGINAGDIARMFGKL